MPDYCACFKQSRKALGILRGARWPVLESALVHGIALSTAQGFEAFDANSARATGVEAIRDEFGYAHSITCFRGLLRGDGSAANPAPLYSVSSESRVPEASDA
jgi:hypothetical protein